MTRSRRSNTIGFDRDIELGWLEATARWAGQRCSIEEIRTHLDELLEGQVRKGGERSARDKTMTVLLHVWVQVPEGIHALRDEALGIFAERPAPDRLALHWGMCIATYPFFRSVVAVIGRLLRLQDSVSLSEITRRATEAWGERSTVIRAARRIARSLVRWGVLVETGERGVYAGSPPHRIADGDDLGPWLVEAALAGNGQQGRPLRSLLNGPELFPFSLNVSPRRLAERDRLEVHRQGLDEDLVVLK